MCSNLKFCCFYYIIYKIYQLKMKNQQQNYSQISNLYEYSSQQNLQINIQQIDQLYEKKQNFINWLENLGLTANIPLSNYTTSYSRQILNNVMGKQHILTLIDRRVEKMIKNHKLKKNWCKEDCTILAWILEKITIGRHVKTPEKIRSNCWETVAALIPGVTADQCMFKWLSMKKTKLSNNKWSQNQSKILQKVVIEIGHYDWKKISRALYFQNQSQDKKFRTPKQCRQQWNCYLNPSVKKGPWTVQEDLKLLKSVKTQGRKWSMICRETLNGRTQNAVKNRYSFLIQHKKQQYPQQSQNSLLKICLNQLEQTFSQKQAKSLTPTLNRKQNESLSPQHKIISFQQPQQSDSYQQQVIKIQQQFLQKITIVECNYEQITKFLNGNRIFVPAKIEKDQVIQYNGHKQKFIMVKINENKNLIQ